MKSVWLLLACGVLAAQEPNPTQQRALMPADTGQPMPIYRVTVVSRTIKAINYHHRSGETRVDFKGTSLLPRARGQAKVESRMGSTRVDARFDDMGPATQFGPEYLTYVLWAITPEGRAQNLGEVVLDGDHSKLQAAAPLQAFGMIVTAEPYFAVTQPSDVVVLENMVRPDTTGTIQDVDAKYELLQRGQYVLNRAQYRPVRIDPKGPLQVAEAENAVQIARLAGAERYAAETLGNALRDLQNARDSLRGGHDKRVESAARQAAQTAEDARLITLRKLREEQMAAERAAAERAENARRDAERQRQAAEAERAAAERAQLEAEAAAQRARRERAEAESARAAALAQQQQLQQEAERARQTAQQAEQARFQAESERNQLRQRLLQQLNLILETRETARGLIVNISDVLFDTGKYTLKAGAREKLAKVSGILLSHPGLKIQVEGHTDNVGGPDLNQRLSERRAYTVRDYLVQQGVPPADVTAVGLGESMPVADNTTAAGRQRNRRVELVVSGELIGTPAAVPPGSQPQPVR